MVNDNGNEVLRKAANDNGDGTYSLSTKNNALVGGIDYDTVNVTYPSDTVETYQYLLSSAVIKTVTITYIDNNKKDINTVVFT